MFALFMLRSQKHFPFISSRIFPHLYSFFFKLHACGTVTLDILVDNLVGSLMRTDCVYQLSDINWLEIFLNICLAG